MAMRPKTCRLVPLDPAELCRDQLLVDAVPGLRQEIPLVHLAGKLGDLAHATCVALLDARPQHRAGLVQENDGGQHAGDADPLSEASGIRRGRHDLAQRRAGIPPPLGRVFLGPAGMRG